MSRRFYQHENSELLFDFSDIGHLLQLSGIVVQGMGETLVLMMPSAEAIEFGTATNVDVYDLDDRHWSEILRQSDDPKFYGPDKAWHRKARHQISGAVQQKVWARDGFKCRLCGCEMGKCQLTVDHWVPLELGGANDTTNYITACRRCNKHKGNKDPKQYCDEKGLNFEALDFVAKSGV